MEDPTRSDAAPGTPGSTPTSKRGRRYLLTAVVAVAIAAVAVATRLSGSSTKVAEAAQEPGAAGRTAAERGTVERFAAARASHPTRLLRAGPSPQAYDTAIPAEVKLVHYASNGASLLGWLAVLPSASETPRPLLVYAHGGFALGAADFDDVRRFYDAGMIVFLPALRGENGNPGTYELAYGEVDDLVAAIRYAAALPGVDPRRVYVIGHSAGGMVSSLAALTPDLPVTLTASIGGVYSPEAIAGFGDFAPFDVDDALECRLRALTPFAAELAHEHVAYVGTEDGGMRRGIDAIHDAARRSNGKLVVVDVPGDHFASVAPAMADFQRRIEASGSPAR